MEVSFELPYLEEAESVDTRWGVLDPQVLCSKRDASVNGRVGPFGLLVLASNDLSEHTAIYFHILKAHNRYVVLMCSDQSRLNPCPWLSIYKHFLSSFFRMQTQLIGCFSYTDRSSFRKEVDKTAHGAFVDIDPRYKKISLRTLVFPY